MDRMRTLVLFCKVVDNYGDIGICWRLARQFRHEHGLEVTLWVDDLAAFKRICPDIAQVSAQRVQGVTVRHWQPQPTVFLPEEIADIVIEFFGCDIPAGYIATMAACRPAPVWLNLEGLTAEAWVEGCHRLSSPHPQLPLTKYFFFPGFTERTGGLPHEAGLQEERRRFQADKAEVHAFLAALGVSQGEAAAFKTSLFCYPHAPVAALFSAWQAGSRTITCLVPEGVAVSEVEAFFDAPAATGMARTQGALTVRVVPFVAQPDYDRLLWACDLNFVRGEDSFVRAQWAGRPFIWHIYPQDKNLHHVKLRAFLQRQGGSESLAAASLWWNDAVVGGKNAAEESSEMALPDLWQRLQADLPALTAAADGWEQRMLANGNLASNLLQFAASIRQGQAQNPL